jgi:hypothetical protein
MASGAGCPEDFHAGASADAWRWLPKVLHMRTGAAESAHAGMRDTDNAAVAALAVFRKVRRECLAIQAPCGVDEICRKNDSSVEAGSKTFALK